MADAPTLSLTSLGVDGDISLYGVQGTQTITVPVPKGLAPGALTADVELPPYVRGGTLTVTQEGRELSRIELLVAESTPLSIPLTGARVADGTVTFTVRSRLLPEEGDCLFDPTAPLQLADAAIDYTGKEVAPARVADFLPPVLEKLTIFTPDKPTAAESDAAVELTTAVVSRYGAQNTDIDIAPLGDDRPVPPSAPLERNVVIREGSDAALTLQGRGGGVPALQISGPSNELANQARLLSSGLSQLALSAKVVAGPINSSPAEPVKQVNLRDLGQPELSATAFEPQVVVGLDQTRIGHPVRDMRVHLKGSYTPLPSTVGGQVVVSIGDRQIDRWAADSSGAIDRSVDLPQSELRRNTKLSVAVDIAGNTGQCGEFQPVTLTIDGDTTVDSSVADPPDPLGFQSVPQALMPTVQVGVEPESFDDTARAVSIMAGLQRLSGARLDTEVVPLSTAIDSASPAVLISADGWNADKVVPPVRSSTDGVVEVQRIGGGSPAKLTLDPATPFASLQVGHSGDRTVLFATSEDAPDQLDSLLDWLDGDAHRWATLDGTAVISLPGSDPVSIDIQAAAPPDTADDSGFNPIWWITAGVGVIIGASVIALAVHRRRHG
ncbi:membrane protein [Mycolicibacterium moriokaense]|uniref:Membrane protein n=1 Tax=Mycolicibacterium moriokaense TaxID=39691 RepID=A0AAD1HGQ9_9MYCO|nr:membrane protein [Mycolicibacterium moriokaense]